MQYAALAVINALGITCAAIFTMLDAGVISPNTTNLRLLGTIFLFFFTACTAIIILYG